MAENTTHHTKRNDHHDKNRLQIGTERNCQQCIDHSQYKPEACLQTTKGITLFARFTFQTDRQIRECGQLQISKVAKILLDTFDVGRLLVDIRSHVQSTAAIDTFYSGKTTTDAGIYYRTETNVFTGRGSNRHLFQTLQGFAFRFRVANHHINIIAITLQCLHLKTQKCLPHLIGNIRQRQTKLLRLRFDRHADFLLAAFKTVRYITHTGIGAQFVLE